jgi:DNA polymerase III gamma/tau subunit
MDNILISARVVWFFCTTNIGKIPKTFQTRCTSLQLKPVADKDLEELLEYVCDKENIDLPNDVISILIREAQGSPRQLLSNISVARTAKNRKEAGDLLKAAIETDASLELCRFIAKGSGSWAACMALLKKLEGENPESIRILAANYLGKCALGAKSDAEAINFLQKLDAFSQPYTNASDGMSPLLLSIGRVLFTE